MGSDFESHNLDAIEQYIAAAYASIRFQTNGREQNHFRATRNTLGPISLDRLDYGFEADYAVEPLGRIALFGVESGSFPHVETDGVRDSHAAGEVFLAAQPDRPYAGCQSRARFSITMLDPSLLSEVAASRRADVPVRLTGYRPVSPAAGRHLLRTIAFLQAHVVTDAVHRESALIASTVPQFLASTVLSTFPSTALTEPTGQDRRDAHPATLRRAVAFIDDHAQREITVADIASAARISIRTLQDVFRRYRGTTPMGYLRQVRLRHAHQELLATDPATGATVIRIAADWGFFHAGRFAHYYRTAYGCAPHQTLERDRP
ncbi:helix-turn-helix transcriptional regulator [Krasilnikovia sp. MM14-A1004]|uniref:helix-turn-helix transcriptional regulator n=1 Tax=Krasilnikovia sp. MM14-A1004 TaxID=3373541 RepID=UPI00399C5D9B